MSVPCITLTTDFGVQDGYVAAMKGVLLSRAPGVRLIDVSHAIPPGDIDAAAHVLRQAAPQFPAGTVHLVVIDPGVGSARRAIVCAVGGQVYVAPDNGVLTAVLPPGAEPRVHAIERAELWAKDPSPVGMRCAARRCYRGKNERRQKSD